MLKIEQPQYLKRAGTVLAPIISGDDFTTTGKGTFGDFQATGTGSFGGVLDMNSNQINEVADPTLDQDAATKKYVDDNDFWEIDETLNGDGTPANPLTITKANNWINS